MTQIESPGKTLMILYETLLRYLSASYHTGTGIHIFCPILHYNVYLIYIDIDISAG